MKITKVKIDRFAGIHNYDASFGENLNVIFGPNEIGKSTLMKAIKFGLFISPDITRQKLNSDFGFVLEDFLPKSGGDRIDVQIDFCVNGVEYKLRKTFGETIATKFSELQFGTTQLNDHKRQNRVLPWHRFHWETYAAMQKRICIPAIQALS